MELKLKIYIMNPRGEKFLGIGVLWLLRAVERQGSIRAAAAELGLSYAKAHRMLCVLETSLDRPVLVRRKGGDNRDGTCLTAYGRQVITAYEKLQGKLRERSEEVFADFQRELNRQADSLPE